MFRRKLIAVFLSLMILFGMMPDSINVYAQGDEPTETDSETVDHVDRDESDNTDESSQANSEKEDGVQKNADCVEGQTEESEMETEPAVSKDSEAEKPQIIEEADNINEELKSKTSEEGTLLPDSEGKNTAEINQIPAVKNLNSANENATEGNTEATSNKEATAVLTAPIEFPEKATWDYSKSKTATNLNDNYISEVTLSLPSAEEQLCSEVVFVLDESDFSDTKEKSFDLLNELKKQVDSSGAKVKVDIIGFKRSAYWHGNRSYDLASEYEDIKNEFAKRQSGGSNIHAGLLLAKEVLAADTSIPDSRKYMILVSDGDTYLYCKNEDYSIPYSRAFAPLDSAKGYAYGGFYDEGYYYPSSPYENNIGRPKTSDAAEWDKYLDDVNKRNIEGNGDSFEFIWNYYDKNWSVNEPTSDEYKNMPCVPRSASNMDMAFLYASQTYHELASKYHCYSVPVQSLNTSDGGHAEFMDYLNGGQRVSFEQIKNDVLYLVGTGTTVEDYMGYVEKDYNFDLYDPASMVITLDNANKGTITEYKAELIGENHYGFKKNGEKYDYEVTYIPGKKAADEHFVWTMNVPITNFVHVSLKYKVILANPKTSAGTYGEYDKDGSQGKKALYTNQRAVLHAKDSAGNDAEPSEFPLPTVSYTVKSESVSEKKTIGVYIEPRHIVPNTSDQ